MGRSLRALPFAVTSIAVIVGPACTVCRETIDAYGNRRDECSVVTPAPVYPGPPSPVAVLELVERDPSQPSPDVLYPGGTLELDGSKSTGHFDHTSWVITTADGAPALISSACTESADHLHLVCPLPFDDGTTPSLTGAYVASLTLSRTDDARETSTARVGFRVAIDSRAPEGVDGLRADFTVCAVGSAPRRCCDDDLTATPTIREGEEVLFESISTPAGELSFRWSVTETDADGFAAWRTLDARAYGFYVVPVTSTSGSIVPWSLQVTDPTTGNRHATTKACVFAPAEDPPPPPPPPPPPAAPSFFVTSRETTAAMGGLAGADALCQAAAEASTLLPEVSKQRTWRAFLSDTPTWQGAPPAPFGDWVHARDRIGRGPWIDATGAVVAADPAALVASGVPATAMFDEEGHTVPGSARVWTGTLSTGLSETEQDNDFLRFGFMRGACLGWTSDNMFAHASAGRWDGSGSWVNAAPLPCNEAAHLYCFAE